MSTLTKDQARGLILAVKKGVGWEDIGAKLGRKSQKTAGKGWRDPFPAALL